MKHNNNNCWESQLAGGKPVGYLQVQLGSWTRDYQEQIQRVVRAGLEPGISGSQGKRPNHWATLPHLQAPTAKNWVLSEGGSKRFLHSEDSLFGSNNATTLYHVTAMLRFHMKHRLFPNKMWSLLRCNKLPWQRESPAKTPYILDLVAHISKTNSVTPPPPPF